jgi:hypothetical protein
MEGRHSILFINRTEYGLYYMLLLYRVLGIEGGLKKNTQVGSLDEKSSPTLQDRRSGE